MLLISIMPLKSESMTIITMINQAQAILLYQRLHLQIFLQYNLYNTIHKTYNIFISFILQISCYTNIFISSQIMILLIILFIFKLNKSANRFIIQKTKLFANSNVYTSIYMIHFQYQKENLFIFYHLFQ